MKKISSLLLLSIIAGAGCSLIAPYTITFTNTPGSVVDPSTATLDFVVSAPTLAYVSAVECEGADPIELLPIVADTNASATLHKLSLEAMSGMPEGAACTVTVTVFDPSTTEKASSSIELTMPGEKVEEVEEVDGETESTGGEETTEDATTDSGDGSGEAAVEAELEVSSDEDPVETSTDPVTETPDDSSTTPSNETDPNSPTDSPATDEPSA